MKKKRTKKKRKTRSLVVESLERVSRKVFRNHYSLITELVGDSPGIYALYDENDLYYVGKSSDLKKRVRRHLSDRHLASWSHFSLYLVQKTQHINEIESLLVTIADPKGNRVKPKATRDPTMLKRLRNMVKQRQREELDEMFGGGGPQRKVKRSVTRKQPPRTAKGLVSKRTPLFKTYKGREYRATLNPNGTIKVGNKVFKSPSAAAKAIVNRISVNGWRFWFIKDSHGEWVKLADYKG